jgi:glutaminyl-tRNA synthetase
MEDMSSYDFICDLSDSFDGIAHAFYITEFELSGVSYEWLCDELGVYKPKQREYVLFLIFLEHY